MRIAIVNDMVMAVEALRRVISTVPEYEVAWTARNGAEAVAKCQKDLPDLILMDLIMPVMDGVEATRQIMANSPCAILIVTATVKGNAPQVFEALGYGALDAVSTPVLVSIPQGGVGNSIQGADTGKETMLGQRLPANVPPQKNLLAKIATVGKLIGKGSSLAKSKISLGVSRRPHLVAIGASTGGPKALAKLLSGLPSDFSGAVAIVQHLDAQFAKGLAEWLNQQTDIPVKVARAGDRLEPGKILIAGTNDHLVLQSNLTLAYTPEPRTCPYRPSVDAFFDSLAAHWPDPGTAVLMTGMGRDGAEGLSHLRAKNWHTIAQDKATSVVYGMPKAAVELGAAVEILPLEAIAPALVNLNV
ncbi:MAG TPA: chemotaxis response regulator protein-glutamate methylesterase [Oscillatoriaceae cyanobacterium M33_DOE_052]|uniref:Protein-glutamate methylesterase/protein-glutamine glutaminase n=1 Tax=Planktothricoides sp. SpSt-374 TaxID=2282167 RepID=A0A7C3ZP42_9CYAN|nr:chemotaxis response regulator protein-glutamate methylesterase [Oscillatoriaceae cyanobacterium M33_DOE_052]